MLKFPHIKMGSNSSLTLSLKQSLATNGTSLVMNHVQYKKKENHPFSHHQNLGPIVNYCSQGSNEGVPFNSKDLKDKDIFSAKIRNGIEQMAVFLNSYCFCEKDEVNQKKNLYYWFHQTEQIFMRSLNLQPSKQEFSKKALQIRNKVIEVPNNQVKYISFKKQNLSEKSNRQASYLIPEIEEYKKINIECLEKIQEISNLLQVLKDNYETEKKRNLGLSEAIQGYVHQTDIFLEKISKKYQKQKILTDIQRDIQQNLIKIKFKTFDYHYRN